jgi:TetR/AcrR family transcriptional repressor of mexJK operon
VPKPADPQRPLRHGSPDKRAAITQAALDVFLRDGYARTSVDTIATEAGVSKRTIYDYYGDKRRLFLSVIEETSAAQTEAFQKMLDRSLGESDDLEAALLAFGREFATAVARSPQRSAVMRLLVAEAAHFPELTRNWRPVGPAQQALAARLHSLARQHRLHIADPLEAAEHFGALVTGAVNNRSLFGTVDLDDTEIDRLVTSGVRAFLRAYHPTAGRP